MKLGWVNERARKEGGIDRNYRNAHLLMPNRLNGMEGNSNLMDISTSVDCEICDL
jgi:hypothetical protein